MNKDIRLHVDFFEHPKTKKLIRVMGYEGMFCLVRLWCYTAKYRPEGELYDLTDEEIEESAGWKGEPGKLIQTLVELRWLEKNKKNYAIHHWEQHNGYAIYAKDRSEQARKAAHVKWVKQHESLKTDADSNADSNADSSRFCAAPFPSPSPTPLPKDKKINTFVKANEGRICFDRTKPGFLNITNSQVEQWQEIYLALDINSEIKKCAQFYKANPKKASQRKNWHQALNNWLNIAQEKQARLIPSNRNGPGEEPQGRVVTTQDANDHLAKLARWKREFEEEESKRKEEK